MGRNILETLPDSYVQPIPVICLAINIKALEMIESYQSCIEFHCLGFSNKANRPIGMQRFGSSFIRNARLILLDCCRAKAVPHIKHLHLKMVSRWDSNPGLAA